MEQAQNQCTLGLLDVLLEGGTQAQIGTVPQAEMLPEVLIR